MSAPDGKNRPPAVEVLAALPVALVGLDAAGRPVLWSGAAPALFGWTAAEVLGHEPRFDDSLDELLRRMRGGPALTGAEGTLPRRDGGAAHVLVWTSPLVLPDGEEGTLLLFGDAAARRRAERERGQLEEQLEQVQRLEAVGRLSGGLAHDFNNLLLAIGGNAEMAEEDVGPDHPAREDLAEIRLAVRRAAELTRQLLAFGQKQALRPRALDPDIFLRKLEPRLLELAGGGQLTLELSAGGALIEADPAELERVVLSLATNAAEATVAGGRIRISTRPVELGPDFSRELIFQVQPGRYVELRVRDTGTGMDEATRARALEPFFSTKPRGPVRGLGLSATWGIVRQSGGYLHVDSEPGEGTTVTVLLPSAETRGGGDAVARHRSSVPRGDERVLLVEDEPAVRALLHRILGRSGYIVVPAGTGEDALAAAGSSGEPIQLLVTDVVMPGMSGAALAEALRRARPDLPVLFISGFNEHAVTGAGGLMKGTSLLSKPFTPSEFLQRVREVLDD